jgi:alpha-tubulin suppressor-like RCC1 family protein
LALKSDGTVKAWGFNASSQTNVPFDLTNVVAISAGWSHSVALKNDGTLVAWGDNSFGQRTIPAGLSNVIAIATRGEHNLALKNDGSVVAWGRNNNGQTNVPSDLASVVKIAAGYFHSMVIQSNGTVRCWGSQDVAPAELNNVFAIAGSDGQSFAISNPNPIFPVQPTLDLTMVAAVLVSGELGKNYRIEYSDILTGTNNWQFLNIITLTTNPQPVIDVDSLHKPKRFYRALLIP